MRRGKAFDLFKGWKVLEGDATAGSCSLWLREKENSGGQHVLQEVLEHHTQKFH